MPRVHSCLQPSIIFANTSALQAKPQKLRSAVCTYVWPLWPIADERLCATESAAHKVCRLRQALFTFIGMIFSKWQISLILTDWETNVEPSVSWLSSMITTTPRQAEFIYKQFLPDIKYEKAVKVEDDNVSNLYIVTNKAKLYTSKT